MPAFELSDEPSDFDSNVRQKGNEWVRNHADSPKRPPDYWSAYRSDLRRSFRSLCGYALMHEMRGTVDHFISWKSDPKKAYDWDNYRFISAIVNSSKQNADDAMWDPFGLEFDWLEIHLPSMIMKVRDDAPSDKKKLIQDTLDRLPISDEDEVIDCRAEYYKGYKRGEMTFGWLEGKVPILAASIKSYEIANPNQPLP